MKCLNRGFSISKPLILQEDGTDFTNDEEIIFKTKLWKTAVTETSGGVYRCEGFYNDDQVGDTTVTFHVLG